MYQGVLIDAYAGFGRWNGVGCRQLLQGFGTLQAVEAQLFPAGGLDGPQAVYAELLQAVAAGLQLFGSGAGGLRLIAGGIHQPQQGHHIVAAAEGGVGVDGAVVVFLHAVVGDEPRLHLVAAVLGGTQVLRTAGVGAAEAADHDPGLPVGDEPAVTVDELRSVADSLVVALVGGVEHQPAGYEPEEYDGIGLHAGRRICSDRLCLKSHAAKRQEGAEYEGMPCPLHYYRFLKLKVIRCRYFSCNGIVYCLPLQRY